MIFRDGIEVEHQHQEEEVHQDPCFKISDDGKLNEEDNRMVYR